MGIYHRDLYGNNYEDPNLLFGEPRSIRSDEWRSATPKLLAQDNNGYSRTNGNIGNGEDVSLTGDSPYKEWSLIFRPHNVAFLVLSVDLAFAFRWWFMGASLILSCYFFVLALLPGKRLLAALLACAVFFSPFIQWWYQNTTLSTFAYALFGGAIFTRIVDAKGLRNSLSWALLLVYVATCFVFVLYPPFQIPAALAMLAFGGGYFIERRRGLSLREVGQKIGILIGVVGLVALIAVAFWASRPDAIDAIKNTAYPGERIQESGGYDILHLLSNHLAAQFGNNETASLYSMNQSEASNFILLLPFLLFPSTLLVFQRRYLKKDLDWPLVMVNALFVVLLGWLFIPNIDILGRISGLGILPHNRLLIGLGVLNLIHIVLFIRCYSAAESPLMQQRWAILYSVSVLFFGATVGLLLMRRFPSFISVGRVVLLSLPVPLTLYLLLRKQFTWAVSVLLAFSATMTYNVNPLYKGTDALTATPISAAIRRIGDDNRSRWATDSGLLQNFTVMNGVRSITGTFFYPQLDLWRDVDESAPVSIYNRYAHVLLTIDRDPTTRTRTKIEALEFDSFTVVTEPCGSDFLTSRGVRYLLTEEALAPQDDCAVLVERIDYPLQQFFIYRLG